MPKQILETAVITEAAAAEAKTSGKMLVQHISPGWGSSGYYSAEVLEAAVSDQLIPAGTHMYADHPTPSEVKERPVRSIKDIVSTTTEDARIATDDDVARGAEIGAIVSEVALVPSYVEVIDHLREHIGVSVRGDGELVEGTADGRTGQIVESLEHVQSVDWVTRAGRGGKVLSLVESARAAGRAIARGLSEATVNDTREALQTALRDEYGNERVGQTAATYVWVRDFDDDTVWFEIDGPGEDSGLYGQSYTQEPSGVVALDGDRTEVRIVTTYVPATRSDSTTTTTKESKEDTMGKIQIEEAEHTALNEKAGRVDALLQENATKDARIAELEEADRRRTRTSRATEIVEARSKDADVTFSGLEVDGLLTKVTVKEDGSFDEDAFTKSVDEAAAAKKAAGGAGRVTGHGGSIPLSEAGDGKVRGWDEIDEALGLQTAKGA